jgi:hypothetical protein
LHKTIINSMFFSARGIDLPTIKFWPTSTCTLHTFYTSKAFFCRLLIHYPKQKGLVWDRFQRIFSTSASIIILKYKVVSNCLCCWRFLSLLQNHYHMILCSNHDVIYLVTNITELEKHYLKEDFYG